MRLRTRASPATGLARRLAVFLGFALFALLAGVATLSLSGSLGAGIGVLFALFALGAWPSIRLGDRLDYRLDAENPAIVLEEDALVVPRTEGAPLRLSRQGLRATMGWYYRRSGSGPSGSGGVFLHLRDTQHDLVLHGDDELGDVARRGVARFASPPKDKERPEIRVWVRELLPLAEALGAYG